MTPERQPRRPSVLLIGGALHDRPQLMLALQRVADVSITDHWTSDMDAKHMKRDRIPRGTDLVFLWREGLSHDQYQRASTAADYASLPHVRLDKSPDKLLELLRKAGLKLAPPRSFPATAAPAPTPVGDAAPMTWTGPMPPGFDEPAEPLSLREIDDDELFALAQLVEQSLHASARFCKLEIEVDERDGFATVRLHHRKSIQAERSAATPVMARAAPLVAPVPQVAGPTQTPTALNTYWKSADARARVVAGIDARWARWRAAKGLPPKPVAVPSHAVGPVAPPEPKASDVVKPKRAYRWKSEATRLASIQGRALARRPHQ